MREFLPPFAACLSALLLVWVAQDMFLQLDDFGQKHLRGYEVAQYYLVKSPVFVVFVLPISLLLALLFALTRHAKSHEITAMRAAGVSLWRIAAPYFAVAFACCVAVLALNELWVPDSVGRAERILNKHASLSSKPDTRHLIRNLGFTNARDGRTWQVGLYDTRTAQMSGVRILWALPDGTTRWINAERAERVNNVWIFYNANQYIEAGRTNSLPVPSVTANVMSMPEFTESPEMIRSEIKIANPNLRRSRDMDLPVVEILNYLALHPVLTPSDHKLIYTKLHGRLAAPWTCLVVVLIALPFGAASGRRNVFFGVGGSIAICFAFYMVQQIGLMLGLGGQLPGWLAGWLPNFIFAGAGAWMTARVR